MTSEADLQVQVADYLRLQYPNVMFHSDFGSGIKLTMGQAIKQKRQNGGRRAWPDMFIAEPRGVKASCKVVMPEDSVIKEAQFIEQKYGLFIELKKAGTRIFKKDGTYWMITSGCTGWAPNEARMHSAQNIMGPWTKHPNPCVGPDKDITFGGQSTYILKVPGKEDAFIFR